MNKRALITGITGQDGSYLADLLLEKGYEVFGMVRHSANPNYWRIQHILNKITLLEGDLTDAASLNFVVNTANADEVYNLAGQSFVGLSWKQPMLTTDITGIGVLRLLEAIRQTGKPTKFYQASSSEMFGKVHEIPQRESTLLHPRSPYGTAKCFGHHTTVNYRESYGMFNVSGILFNHESPRRGIEFVTRKITDGVARIALGAQKELRLGNLDAKRDWGHAHDYMEAAWLMLQQSTPEDFIIATGETHSVEEFCNLAFSHVGLNYSNHVLIDPQFVRPAEVDILLGDPSKAKQTLQWQPKHTFKQLVEDMVEADLARVKKELGIV